MADTIGRTLHIVPPPDEPKGDDRPAETAEDPEAVWEGQRAWLREGVAERGPLAESLRGMGRQPCHRAPEDDATARPCETSDLHITKWCLPCYVRAALADTPVTASQTNEPDPAPEPSDVVE